MVEGDNGSKGKTSFSHRNIDFSIIQPKQLEPLIEVIHHCKRKVGVNALKLLSLAGGDIAIAEAEMMEARAKR